MQAIIYCFSHIFSGNHRSGIEINGNIVPDHAMIQLDNFGTGSEIPCFANGQCCSIYPQLSPGAQLGASPSGIGSWRYPNGSYVRLLLAGDSYGITRETGQVNLHRQSSLTAEGMWRCEVPGLDGTMDTVHFGIYTQGRGKYFSYI